MTTTCLIGVVVDDDSNAKLELLSKRDAIISAAIVVEIIFVIETGIIFDTYLHVPNRFWCTTCEMMTK